MTASKRLAILGAGPVGLDAALAGSAAGFDVTVLEAGRVGEHLRRWGHVTLFSPWGMNVSPRMREALESRRAWPGWNAGHAHTGAEYVEHVLEPLARHASLRGRIRTGTRVVGVARKGALKNDYIGDPRRAATPFEILHLDARGREGRLEADLVMDCTGTYSHPNHLGGGGLPVPGERAAARVLEHGNVDVAGAQRRRYAGRRTLLLGAGNSAATTALAFRDLMTATAGTRLTWAVREPGPEVFTPLPEDSLPLRARLLREAGEFARSPSRGLTFLAGATVESVAKSGAAWAVTLATPAGRTRVLAERIIANVGYSPDNQIYRELQVHECYATLGPMKLSAALLGAGGADCVQQTTHGVDTLLNPETDFFLLGAKSYGRNNTFLLRVGFEQVTEVFEYLAARGRQETA